MKHAPLRLRRRIGFVIGLLFVGVAALALWGGLWLRGSLPELEGTLMVEGLGESVTVTRGEAGVPVISARSTHDAYFALGWVHAQDRLWQMEFQRRVGAGRLAEVVGEAGLPNDRFMRTLGLYTLARDSFAALDEETQAGLTAYADGVNAWIEGHHGKLPLGFTLLNVRPEKWVPADSLVWGRVMSLQLTNNWRDEITRSWLASLMGPERMRQLWPGLPAESPVTVAKATGDALWAALPEAAEPRQASNLWAVSGSHTASGKPLVANDPHLAFQMPVAWYLVGVETPAFQVSGATIPGIPFHLIGHNGVIAWGTTTTQADTVDLFIEKELDFDHYQTETSSRSFTLRMETIAVKDGPDFHFKVRSTRHGPVLSDVLPTKIVGSDEVIVFRATALEPEDQTAQAFFHLNRAKNWEEFSGALATFHSPVQNMVYADTSGSIGFATVGRVPVRGDGDGSLPLRGWRGEGEWKGWVPFDAMPRVLNPESGTIINANNKVVPDRYPYLLSAAWPEGYRAQRIADLLHNRNNLTVQDMAAVQLDHVSLAALDLKDLLLSGETSDPRALEAKEILKPWEGSAGRELAAPLLFSAWLEAVWEETLADELGSGFGSFRLPRPLVLLDIFKRHREWCNNLFTAEQETCEQVSGKALERAMRKLAERHSGPMSEWRWGGDHQVALFSPIFHQSAPLRYLLDRKMASDGDDFTINRGSFELGTFSHTHGAGLRVIYDLGKLSDSRFVLLSGESEHPLSPHYDDMMERWRDNQGVRIGGGERKLTLGVKGP